MKKQLNLTTCLITIIAFFLAPQIFAQNVGIGTSNPATKLHVYDGSVRVDHEAPFLYLNDTTLGNYAGIQFQRQGNTLGNIHFRTFSDFLRINADAGSGLRNDLVIKSTGNIGLGTAAPSEKLHIYGGNLLIEDEAPFIYLNDTSLGNNTGIVFQKEGTSLGYLYYRTFADYLCMSTDGVRKDLVIKSNGNVGIGTASPDFRFHVRGGDVLFEDGSPFLYLNDTTNGGNSGFAFLGNDFSKGYLYYSMSEDLLRINAETGAGARNDLVIANSGKVGIGTATPTAKLTVDAGDIEIKDNYPYLVFNDTLTGGGVSGLLFKAFGANQAFFRHDKLNDRLEMSTDNAFLRPDLVITNSGFVGLGTNSPAYKLHVSGGDVRVDETTAFVLLNATTAGSGNAGISFQNEAASKGWLYYDIPDNLIRISNTVSGGRNDLVVLDNGNVGIGTAAPVAKFQVVGSDTLGTMIISPNESVSNDKSELILAEDYNNNFNMSIRFDGTDNKLKVFSKVGSTTYGPHMVITRQTGNVGIGIDSPTSKLHVGGNVLFTGALTVNSSITGTGITSEQTTPYIFVNKTNTTGTSGYGFKEQGANIGWIFYDHTNDHLTINADAGTGARRDIAILSDGKVGIGTSAPTEQLQVNGNIRVSAANPYLYLNNTSTTGFSTIKFQEAGTDNKALYVDNTSENFILYDYSQASYQFVVTAVGRVGIGTNTPSYMLEVVGGDIKSGGDFITNSLDGVINAGGSISATANVIGDAATPGNTIATGDEDLYIEDDLEVTGQGYKPGGGSWGTVSDKRLKKDIKPYTDGLAKLLQIEPVSYSYNGNLGLSWDDGKEYVGVVAQDINRIAPYMIEEKVLGQVISENEDGSERILSPGEPYLTFDGSALTYMLINSVKEQQGIIETQQSQIEELSRQVELLLEKLGTE